MYIVQIVLGLPTPKMPVRPIERIVLLSMLFFYFLQSSYIFTNLSEMQLQKKSFQRMETFKDLIDADFTLVRYTRTPRRREDLTIMTLFKIWQSMQLYRMTLLRIGWNFSSIIKISPICLQRGRCPGTFTSLHTKSRWTNENEHSQRNCRIIPKWNISWGRFTLQKSIWSCYKSLCRSWSQL